MFYLSGFAFRFPCIDLCVYERIHTNKCVNSTKHIKSSYESGITCLYRIICFEKKGKTVLEINVIVTESDGFLAPSNIFARWRWRLLFRVCVCLFVYIILSHQMKLKTKCFDNCTTAHSIALVCVDTHTTSHN